METKEASNHETQKISKKERNKLSKFLKTPIKILIKARDFYIRSMTVYSGHLDYAAMTVGCPVGQVATILPKSFSVNSTKSTNKIEHYNDQLLMASSTRSYGNKFDHLDFNQRRHAAGPTTSKSPARTTISGGCHVGPDNILRSRSLGIGRIDEEKECEFGEVKVIADVYPRSRSYAVSKRTGMF